MTPKEFVAALGGEAPSREDLLAIELTAREADEFLQAYTPIPKKPESASGPDPISELLSGWNWKKVMIGTVQFSKKTKLDGNLTSFGSTEDGDLIAVDSETGEIVVVSADKKRKRLWTAAVGFESFLDALILAARHFSRCLVDEAYYFDEKNGRKAARACAKAAGSSEYVEFYSMMFGV